MILFFCRKCKTTSFVCHSMISWLVGWFTFYFSASSLTQSQISFSKQSLSQNIYITSFVWRHRYPVHSDFCYCCSIEKCSDYFIIYANQDRQTDNVNTECHTKKETSLKVNKVPVFNSLSSGSVLNLRNWRLFLDVFSDCQP